MSASELSSQSVMNASQETGQKSGQRRSLWLGLALLTLVAVALWLYQMLTHINVTDARVGADTIVISSRVAGRVSEVAVRLGDQASKDQLIARIDDRDSRLLLQELEARLQGIAERRTEIETRIKLLDEQSQNRITLQEAVVHSAEAALASSQAQQDLARIENTRVTKLVEGGAVVRAQQDKSRTMQETSHQQVLMAQAALDNAKAALAQAKTARDEITIMQQQLKEIDPEEQQLKAQKQRIELDLADRVLVMPFNGVVDQVPISEGEYATPGQRLALIHDPEGVWVDANVKETDIRYFHIGKPVEVTVDALPGQVFKGEITRLGQTTTSEFALLPNPNPSGNFTKITQRVPVRISVKQQNLQLKPGMMVEVELSTRD